MAFRGKKLKDLKGQSVLPEPDPMREDPLEMLLDEQSDAEFGELVPRARAGNPVKLAEWSAQDFSSIYSRFRPHLERHARRFLSNPSQVDEVVQDAFLYLMVSLPELDSEIGVLRFLKWKTRLLALDVIRASGRAYVGSIDDFPEPESSDPEASHYLEQQDDAAVVKLALSKLNPRHREVLIASIYEEKSTEEIAAQVGLSENATRQLIFRARSAFKKAFIGDVDTAGMSAAAILSVAARKAAQEGRKIGVSALALVALVVMSMSFIPGLGPRPISQLAESPSDPTPSPQTREAAPVLPPAGGESSSSPSPKPAPQGSSSPSPSAPNVQPSVTETVTAAAQRMSPSPSPAQITDPEPLGVLFDASFRSSFYSDASERNRYLVFLDNGISASFVFNPLSKEPFSDFFVEFEIDNELFSVFPDQIEWTTVATESGSTRYVLFGSLNYLFDEKGTIWSKSTLAKSTIRLDVLVDPSGSGVKSAELSVLPNG